MKIRNKILGLLYVILIPSLLLIFVISTGLLFFAQQNQLNLFKMAAVSNISMLAGSDYFKQYFEYKSYSLTEEANSVKQKMMESYESLYKTNKAGNFVYNTVLFYDPVNIDFICVENGRHIEIEAKRQEELSKLIQGFALDFGGLHFNMMNKKMVLCKKLADFDGYLMFEIANPYLDAGQMLLLSLIVFGLFVGIIFLLINMLTIRKLNTITLPINDIGTVLKDISERQGDLTRKFEIRSNDEMGEFSKYFNSFIQTLNNLIKRITLTTSRTKEISGKLAQTSDQSLVALEEIRKNTESVRDKSSQLDEEISNSNKLSIEIENFISNVMELITTQSADVSESSASIEEMAASIHNVAKTVEKKEKVFSDLNKIVSFGENTMNETIEIMKKVADSVSIIMELLDVINNIASQTNLLAMNASIEAAHAGEYGKGFNVVADEIRKLAENTSINSKEITDSLKKVVEDIKKSESSTEKAGAYFKSLTDGMKDVSNGMFEVKNAMNELASGGAQITSALGSLVKITADIKNSGSEMKNKIDKIASSMNNVTEISNDTRNGIVKNTSGINEIYKAISFVVDFCSKNESNISEIEQLLGKFKTE